MIKPSPGGDAATTANPCQVRRLRSLCRHESVPLLLLRGSNKDFLHNRAWRQILDSGTRGARKKVESVLSTLEGLAQGRAERLKGPQGTGALLLEQAWQHGKPGGNVGQRGTDSDSLKANAAAANRMKEPRPTRGRKGREAESPLDEGHGCVISLRADGRIEAHSAGMPNPIRIDI